VIGGLAATGRQRDPGVRPNRTTNGGTYGTRADLFDVYRNASDPRAASRLALSKRLPLLIAVGVAT